MTEPLNFELRPINASHLEEVAKLEAACFAEPWSVNSLRLLLGDTATGFVALHGEQPIAYGGMLWAPDEGQITNIAVHPDFRRRGCARAILLSLMRAAEERGVYEISLEVRASNEAAIALYRAEGFFEAGRRHNFYRRPTEDALVMLWRGGEAE